MAAKRRGPRSRAEIPHSGECRGHTERAPQLAPHLAKCGITINALDPGPTDTGWMSKELKEQLRKESKRGKVNTPEDIARLIVSILTEKKYPTGEVIHAER